jgi:hypothetical protein
MLAFGFGLGAVLSGVTDAAGPELVTPSESPIAAASGAWALGEWEKLPTDPYPGKQDDIVFPTREVGFYGNGKGLIYKTTDGGDSWQEVFNQPGTFVRCLGFIDETLARPVLTGWSRRTCPGCARSR